MGYFKIFSDKDTWISNTFYKNNYGQDTALNLSVSSANSSSFSRSLIHFPISQIQFDTLSSSCSATLRMENVRTGQFTDSEYYLELYPITEDWIEGHGTYSHAITGATSYIQRTQTSNWSTSGGSYTASPSSSMYFNAGTESLTADISSIVNWWKAGNPNYGILVKHPSIIEALTGNYFNSKAFFARNTPTLFKPYIDVQYNSPIITDDTNNLHLGNNRFFFKDRNVSATAYPGTASIKLDSSSSASTGYPLIYFSANTWYIEVANNTLDYDSYYFVVSNMTFGYSLTSSIKSKLVGNTFGDISNISVNVNTQKEYSIGDTPTLRAFVYNLVRSRMGTYSNIMYPDNVYLYFIEKNSRKVVTPELNMGYDDVSYIYDFSMSNLLPGFWYVPVVKTVIGNSVQYKANDESVFYVDRGT